MRWQLIPKNQEILFYYYIVDFFWEILFIASNCTGICIRYKAKRLDNGGRYVKGQKRCQRCEIFINWEGLWCPCCSYRLRLKPRNKKYKTRFEQEILLNDV
jgi:hypothetical protein